MHREMWMSKRSNSYRSGTKLLNHQYLRHIYQLNKRHIFQNQCWCLSISARNISFSCAPSKHDQIFTHAAWMNKLTSVCLYLRTIMIKYKSFFPPLRIPILQQTHPRCKIEQGRVHFTHIQTKFDHKTEQFIGVRINENTQASCNLVLSACDAFVSICKYV